MANSKKIVSKAIIKDKKLELQKIFLKTSQTKMLKCKSVNEYKQYFENYVIIYAGKFYCYLCDFTSQFLCQHDILLHIEDEQHNTIKSLVPNMSDICSHYLNELEEYASIVSNCIIYLYIPGMFYCFICNTNIPDTIINLNEHIKGKGHNTKKLTFKFETCETNILLENCLLTVPKDLYWVIKTHNIRVFKDRLYCSLCNVNMVNNSAVESHLRKHERFKNIYQKYCESKLNKVTYTDQKNEDSNSLNNIIPDQKDIMKKSTKTISKNNEFVNVKFQDKHTDINIEISEKTTIKRLNNIDTESIFSVVEEIKSSIYSSLFKTNEIIYCLICQKNISKTYQEYYDHVFSTEHLVNLNKTIQIKGIYQSFTKLVLAKHGIKDNKDEFLFCILCNVNIKKNKASLYKHIHNTTDHQLQYDLWMKACLKFYNKIWICIKNNWYYVNKYRCNICCKEFDSEISFVEHINKQKNIHDLDGYNFHSCVPCGLLWYDDNLLYSAHSKTVEHKYMVSYGNSIVNKIPDVVGQLLVSCEENAETLLQFSHSVSLMNIQDDILTNLKNDISLTLDGVKAYIYGSRICGLGLPDNDTNILLDCSNVHCVKRKSTQRLMKIVKRTLLLKPDIWEVQTTCEGISETQTLKVQFIPRKLYCSISINNTIAVESTNLLKRFNEVCTPCRKLILILKKWLSFCGISGLPYISNYALTWCVIFYLQQMSILPCIIELIEEKNKSKLVNGWQVGVSHDLNARENVELSFKELLAGFFMYFADFDYRCNIICPLLGKEIKKTAFTNLSLLPNEMAPYINNVTNNKSTKFRLSPMCVQDPFILSDNLTSMIQKNTLNRFRIFCSESAGILINSF